MPQTASTKTVRDLLGSDERLVFIRGGYATHYDSRHDTLPPQGGGSHNDDGIGWECNNFRPWRGRYYIYTRARESLPLNLQRLGASAGADEVGRVMVVQVATRPGFGQVVIGWFRNATAYADWQERPFASSEGCAFTAPKDRVVLLPEEERTIPVPKGKGAMGQSQVRYASDASGQLELTDWMIDILTEIRQREPENPASHAPPQSLWSNRGTRPGRDAA